MNAHKLKPLLAIAGLAGWSSASLAQDAISTAFGSGRFYANFNVRHESVQQDNALEDAAAMTLRTRLGYETGESHGFSALFEIEDTRIVAGRDEYTVGPTGFNPGQYSVIADPETTELDQGFLQYKKNAVTVKVGRQLITYDNHRFVGHVGWRQDRQTFDAATIQYVPMENLTLNYGYVGKRNRIFAEDADIDSKDHLLNASYKTPAGTVTAYAYLLEVDDPVSNGLDTYGVSFTGSKQFEFGSLLYALEFATQDSSSGATSFDADYARAEAGVSLPKFTARLGYELLGTDNGQYGFSTPLATLHAFNGWSDQFLSTPAVGLEDAYLSVSGNVAKLNWMVVYHDFSPDESSVAIDDLGNEYDLSLTRKFAGRYTVGAKYAVYDAGDAAAGKVDTDKLWAWVTLEF